jgi:hypothetical protein
MGESIEPIHYIVIENIPYDGPKILYVTESLLKARRRIRPARYVEAWCGKRLLKSYFTAPSAPEGTL